MQKRRIASLDRAMPLLGALLLTLLLSTEQLQAQTSARKEPLFIKPVTINFRNIKLLDAIRIVMKAMHADYVLNNTTIPNINLTIHLNHLPAKYALEYILRASGTFTYTYENGVFFIEPIREVGESFPPPVAPPLTKP